MNRKRSVFLFIVVLAGLLFYSKSTIVNAQSLPSVTDPKFSDIGYTQGKIQGSIEFKPASDQSSITDYSIYFTDETGRKIKYIGNVNVKESIEYANYAKSHHFSFYKGYYGLNINNEIDIPSGAAYIGIFAKNDSVESDSGATLYIWDQPVNLVKELKFADTNPKRGIEGTLRWKSSLNSQRIKEFKISYFDGSESIALPEPYGHVKYGQEQYEIVIPAGVLSNLAKGMDVVPITTDGSEAPGSYVEFTDDISGDNETISVLTNGIPVPTKVRFRDQDSKRGTIGGHLTFESDDREFINQEYSTGDTPFSYSLYFLDSNDKKMKGIVSTPRNISRAGSYYVDLPNNIEIPTGAKYIGIFVQLPNAEGAEFGKVEVRDNTNVDYYAKNVQFADENPEEGSIHGKLIWNASDHEEDLKGYAIFSGDNAAPFAFVEKGASYEISVPDSISAFKTSVIKVIPVGNDNTYLYSYNFRDGIADIGDNTLSKQQFSSRKLDYVIGRVGDTAFRDDDPRPGFIGGLIKMGFPYTVEGTIEVYFYDRAGNRLAVIGKVEYKKKRYEEDVYFSIPQGTSIPPGANYIGWSKKDSRGDWDDTGTFILDNCSQNKVTFTDVDIKTDYYIRNLVERGIINGFDDGTFRKKETVTRAQFAAMIVRAFRLQPESYTQTFSDVNAEDWFAGIVATTVKAGLLQGYEDGSFHPEQVITRKEMYAIAERIFGWRYTNTVSSSDIQEIQEKYTDANEIPQWLYPAIDDLRRKQLIVDSGKLELNKQVTRDECAVLIGRIMEPIR